MQMQVLEVDDQVDEAMEGITDLQDQASALELDVNNLKRDLASLTQCHNNLQQDYGYLAHNSKLLHQAVCCCLRDLMAWEAIGQGGPNNPIIMEDDPVVAQQEVVPWEEVPVQEVEVVQEVVYVGWLVLIEEDVREPRERDLPDPPAPPYVP